MNLSTYQELAKRTATHPDPNADMYELMALGLIGETGEVVDLIKKHKFHGVPMDVEKLKKEVGDCLWYFVNAHTLGDQCLHESGDVNHFDAIYLSGWASDLASDLVEHHKVSRYPAEYYLSNLDKLCKDFDFTLECAAEANIEKLKRRYPDGFDLERAANHDSE